MCHTSATLAQGATETGGAWRCVRCGQHWDAARLAAVAAYAAWTIEHDRVGQSTEVSHDPAPYCDPPNEAGLRDRGGVDDNNSGRRSHGDLGKTSTSR